MSTMNVVVMQVVENPNGTRTVTLQNRITAPAHTEQAYRQTPLVLRADHALANAPIGSEHVIDAQWLEGGDFVYIGRVD